jgi:hypothetical protein
MTRRNGSRLRAAGEGALFLAVACLSMTATAQQTPAPTGQAAQAAPADSSTQTDLYSVNATGSPEKMRTGFFADTSVGGYLTFGGQDSYSNLSAFLEIGVGYDILRDLSVALRFQLGPSASDCYAAAAKSCPAPNPDTFTITTMDLAVSYRFLVGDRLYVPVRLMGGLSLLNPTPDNTLATKGSLLLEPNLGVASGIEWVTPFDHFTLDAEVQWQLILGINASAISFYPTVRYTF